MIYTKDEYILWRNNSDEYNKIKDQLNCIEQAYVEQKALTDDEYKQELIYEFIGKQAPFMFIFFWTKNQELMKINYNEHYLYAEKYYYIASFGNQNILKYIE